MSSLSSSTATTNDFKIKIRSADEVGGYLFDKLKVDSTMTMTIGDGVSGEKITISINSLVQNNYAATSDPLVTSDSDSGYSVGSEWINTSDGGVFKCVDSTVGAATWTELT